MAIYRIDVTIYMKAETYGISNETVIYNSRKGMLAQAAFIPTSVGGYLLFM